MFTNRSHQKEILDLGSEYYTAAEYAHCQKMLFRINKLFGFFQTTKRLLKKFPNDISLLDIGCGAGLFILELNRYFPRIKMHGIDIAADAIILAKQHLIEKPSDTVSFEHIIETHFNYQNYDADIILTTLMCHHLNDEELIEFLHRTYTAAKQAVIINDLHRHPLSSYLYRLISPLFRNRLITHDGYISIQRGFVYSEWEKLLQAAAIKHYDIHWHFPFRWQVILWKK